MNKRELILLLRSGIAGNYKEKRNGNEEWIFIQYLPLTFQEIGNLFGVSRQRIHQIASNPNYRGQSGRPRKTIIGNAEL